MRFFQKGSRVAVLLESGAVVQCDAKPLNAGVPLSSDEFAKIMQQKYGEVDVAIPPSPGALAMERAAVPKPAASPSKPAVRVAPAAAKQSETVGPDGKRRIR